MPNLDPTPPPPLPPRDPRGHKGTFGTASVVGGCAVEPGVMLGAPTLAARAALRSGVGLVRLAMPASILAEGLTIETSATGVALPVDHELALTPHACAPLIDELTLGSGCVAVGPGMGSGEEVTQVVLRVLQQDDAPAVVDADALNALARTPEFVPDLRAPAVWTPHPGEFRRLADPLRINHDPTESGARPDAAEELAQRLGGVVVLKGAGTIVSDGQHTWVCEAGHACLATGGSGDVLTGLIAGLVAQHVQLAPIPGALSLYDAARIAVLAHARAGELWAHENASAGLRARELADLLPGVLEPMRH
jgi:hydroxyethylthiazole kinase-like uncharacterized protein yjeF